MKSKISIIVPIYNGEKYLDKCINSIINQNYSNLEIILINDGSIDNSLSIIKKYQENDNRIIIIDKKNEGQAVARNLGLTKCTGEYVLFIDCDDYIEETMVKKMYDKAKNNDSDIVCCNLKTFSNDNMSIIKGLCDISKDNRINFILSNPGPCAKIYKKTFLDNINFKFLEGRIYEDLAVIPSLAINTNKILYIDEALYIYEVHSNSTMKQVEFNSKLLDIFYSINYLSENFNDKYSEELEYIYIKHLLHDASLRFLEYNYKSIKKYLLEINNIINLKYPDWKSNKYLNLMDKKEIILTKLIYKKHYLLYKLYRKVTHK